jgi:tRNA threonylcarbamoyladenosine biosynthesis protein TsaB
MSMPRLTLAIETSNPSAATGSSGPGVAAGLVGPLGIEVLGVEMLRTAGRHDDDLMAAVERLWSGVARGRGEIERVAVSIGPGGYTGLRIAVVAAKMIAEAAGASCVGVPSALVVARRASPDLPRPFGVALASKGETTVVTVFASSDASAAPPREIDAATLGGLGVRGLIADMHLPRSVRERCAIDGIRVDAPVFDPVACLEASALLGPVDPAELMPLYGREPEAVRRWRELHGGR